MALVLTTAGLAFLHHPCVENPCRRRRPIPSVDDLPPLDLELFPSFLAVINAGTHFLWHALNASTIYLLFSDDPLWSTALAHRLELKNPAAGCAPGP